VRINVTLLILVAVGSLSIGISYAIITPIGAGDDVSIPSTKKFYVDGGSNTYIYEAGSDTMDFVVGNSIALRSENSGGVIKSIIPSGQRIYFDGGANTYINSPGSATMDFVVGNTIALRSENSGGTVKLIIPSTNRMYLDGGANSYLTSLSSSKIAIFTGNTETLTLDNGKVGIGTSSPLEKLQVNGNIRLTGNIVSLNDICIGTCP